MIKVSIEMWPGGDERLRHEIASMTISNESNLADVSSYRAVMDQYPNKRLGIQGVHLEIDVHGHCRGDGVLALLERIFAARGQIDSSFPRAPDRLCGRFCRYRDRRW